MRKLKTINVIMTIALLISLGILLASFFTRYWIYKLLAMGQFCGCILLTYMVSCLTELMTEQELRKLLEIETLETVEIYDNSHIQGTSSVGVCVFADCKGFVKSGYRRFNITQAQSNDDFDM